MSWDLIMHIFTTMNGHQSTRFVWDFLVHSRRWTKPMIAFAYLRYSCRDLEAFLSNLFRSRTSSPFGLLRWPRQRWLRCECVCVSWCLSACLFVRPVSASLCACVSVPVSVCVYVSSSVFCLCVCACGVCLCTVCVCVRLCLYLCLCVCVCMCFFAVCLCRSLKFCVYLCLLLLRIRHSISISFLLIICIIFNEAFTYNVFDATYKRVTCSSTLSGHPSSHCIAPPQKIETCFQNGTSMIFTSFSRFYSWLEITISQLSTIFNYEHLLTIIPLLTIIFPRNSTILPLQLAAPPRSRPVPRDPIAAPEALWVK